MKVKVDLLKNKLMSILAKQFWKKLVANIFIIAKFKNLNLKIELIRKMCDLIRKFLRQFDLFPAPATLRTASEP